jgi:hypothetical protein
MLLLFTIILLTTCFFYDGNTAMTCIQGYTCTGSGFRAVYCCPAGCVLDGSFEPYECVGSRLPTQFVNCSTISAGTVNVNCAGLCTGEIALYPAFPSQAQVFGLNCP